MIWSTHSKQQKESNLEDGKISAKCNDERILFSAPTRLNNIIIINKLTMIVKYCMLSTLCIEQDSKIRNL